MYMLGIIALCVVLLIGGGEAWYLLAYRTYTYRFRLTIAVDVDGETATASGVLEVRNVTQPAFGGAPPVVSHVYGDAVFLDLGANGNLIAILGFGPNGSDDRTDALMLKAFGLDLTDQNFSHLQTLRGSRELTGDDIPTLVTFADPTDPRSARVVGLDQFGRVFGKAVRFKRAWIEMTGEPVTRGIEKRVTWAGNYEAETIFEHRLRETGGGGGGSLTPGSKLRRGI